jgi:hypothetical protein
LQICATQTPEYSPLGAIGIRSASRPYGTTQALYIDGLRVATSNLTKLLGYDAQPLLIGCDKESGQLNYFLNGRIDDIAIYNRALDYAEVMAIHHAGPAGKQAPL